MAKQDSSHSSGLPNVDGYTIERLIDTGGFSRVYLATQHGLDRPVAIKVLNSTFEDERQQLVFERECKVMGQLSSHPNIVTVFASTLTESSRPCIVMELYDGTYRSEGILDIREVIDVGAQVADALQTIHDRGIVHRDIKPHNIFISNNGVPAIGDFGISSLQDERTMTGAAGFSINYAPPEVFEEGGAGAPGDVYSLGATLYQLATGEVPFPHHGDQTDRVRATVHKIITAAPPSLNAPGTPPALDRLLRRCMSKQAADRPTSPDAVATELRRIQREVGLPERRPRPVQEPVAGTPRDNNTVQRSEPKTESRTVLREVTARPAPADSPEATGPQADEQRSGSAQSRRRLLIGSAVGVAVITAAIALTGGDGDSEQSTVTVPSSTRATTDVVVLSPPTEVVVSAEADGSFSIDWAVDDPSLKYQVSEVGTDDNRIVDSPPHTWDGAEVSGPGCFTVRTVNAEETKMSQQASAPTCAP